MVSLARPILAGVTYMITRRVTQGMFLLVPSDTINQIVKYCVALAAEETGVLVHSVCAMSNHIHINVTDPKANLPKFTYIAFKYIAKSVNAHRGRWENLWAANVQPSHVVLADDAAKLDKMAYVRCNPVESALVRQAKHWPGVNLWRPRKYKVNRPKVFFRVNGPMPASLKLELTPIPLGTTSKARDIEELVGQAIEAREKELRAAHKAAGRKYLGVERARDQSPTNTPWTKMPRRQISPRVATRDKWRRIESLLRLKDYTKDYRSAYLAWKDGDRDVIFPAGVYKLRVEHSVRCAET